MLCVSLKIHANEQARSRCATLLLLQENSLYLSICVLLLLLCRTVREAISFPFFSVDRRRTNYRINKGKDGQMRFLTCRTLTD